MAPLLNSNSDYDAALEAALPLFDGDRPNIRVVHYTIPSSTTRLVLAGTGVIAGMSGLDAWSDGASRMTGISWPYATTTPSRYPLTEWFIERESGGIVSLELTSGVSSGVMRLEFAKPHEVSDIDPLLTSVRAADVKPLAMLVAAEILQMASTRAAQNTGTSSIPNDSVDRRSQSDIFKSRADDLRKMYRLMIDSTTTLYGLGKTVIGNIPLVRA